MGMGASQCCAFNQCSHFSTMSDLRALINAEKVEKLGYGHLPRPAEAATELSER